MLETLEAVYYSQQVPSSPHSLTVLGLVFDRIYFPGVYIPSSGFDPEQTNAEIKRIQNSGRPLDLEGAQLLECMSFALHKKHVEDFCIFTATGKDTFGLIEKETPEIARELASMIYGPPPPGFTPTIDSGHAKLMPGSKSEAIRYPGWLYYPANALVFAAKKRLPLINDNASLPVPGLGGASPKDNAKLLATILTIESIKLTLPELPVLMPEELAEFRAETREAVKPFRRAILKLAKELNAEIHSDAKLADVQASARFLAETSVVPAMEDLRGAINSSGKPWHKRAVKLVPALVGAFFGMPTSTVVAQALGAILGELYDWNDERREKEQRMKRGEFHFLLQMQEKLKTP